MAANIFDQFDEKPAANPFDQFDAPGSVGNTGSGVSSSSPAAGVIPSPLNPGMHPVAEQVGKAGRVLVNALASPAVLASRAYEKATKGTRFEVPMADLDAEINAGMDRLGIAKMNPDSLRESITMDIARAAPAMALPTTLPMQMLGNAAIGAIQSKPGEEGTGAAVGGAAGAAGHVLGRTLSGLITPSKGAQHLIDKGVALTPGQAAGAGTFVNRVEQAMASNPIGSVPIRAAQRRGVEEANVAAAQDVVRLVDQSVKPGRPPREAIEQTRDAISKTYDNALEGMSAPTDVVRHQLDSQFQTILADNPMMTSQAFSHMRKYVANRLDNLWNNGTSHLDGKMLKQIDSEIGSQIRRLQSSANAADKTAAPAWRDLQQSFREVMEMGAGSPEQAAQLSRANNAYRQLLALERALLPGNSTFTPRRISSKLEGMGIKGTH